MNDTLDTLVAWGTTWDCASIKAKQFCYNNGKQSCIEPDIRMSGQTITQVSTHNTLV